MSQPARSGARSPIVSPASGQQTRRLKRGELLFAEGENSRAMYFVKTGMIRLFKKKGDSQIELDTIHTGQVVGELAFLDGNPRSASGEALTDLEVIEISGPAFSEVLTKIPDWLKILLKTVVARLRTASTRIRQLESASTAFDYSEKDGKKASHAHYVYLSPPDVLKICTSILLVASRNGKPAGAKGIEIKPGILNRYANQIMGIPVAKVTSMIDILATAGVMSVADPSSTESQIILQDPDFLEQLIAYLNEENLLEPSKRHDISIKGFLIMSLISKHIQKYPNDPETGSQVNVAEVRKLETRDGKELFRMDDFAELVTLGYAQNINIKSNDEAISLIKPDVFVRTYKFQRVVMGIRAVNDQKAKGGR
jgi:CRP/FNR family transcriptional regulator, cyclic AMP receptor protein